MANTDKQQILNEAFKNIEKEFWKWAVMRLGDNVDYWNVKTFSSGSYMLDTILGWGYPEGRVVEIYGPESSWKTTLALHAISEVQQNDDIAAFIDAEHALDPEYSRKLGVDTDNLILSQPDYGEQALQIAQELAQTWVVKLIVIDSVSALVPKTEVEWDMGDSHVWLQARLMSQGLRKLAWILSKTWTTVIFINQIRSKIWIMFGNPETTSWGNALKFFGSQRIEIRRGEKIEENKEQIGYKAKVKVVKNKIAPPFKNIETIVKFDRWIDRLSDLVDAGLHFGFISRSGAFYSVNDQKVQWKEKLLTLLEEDENIRNNLEEQIKNAIKNTRTSSEGDNKQDEVTSKDENNNE